jgi:hypothetical protein
MGHPDIPEILILCLLFGGAMWALYNWTHPMTGPRH